MRREEKPHARRDERAARTDLLVQLTKSVPVPVYREPGHDPDHLPQEVDDRGNVAKLHAAMEFPYIVDDQPRSLGAEHRPLRVAIGTIADGLYAHHELRQFSNRAMTDVLREVPPTGLQDARNLVRYGGMRPDRDVIQVDPALSYGLSEYLRTLQMLHEHGWSWRRCIPHGGHQFSLHLAAALKLGGNESYPGEFQPTGGFADGAVVRDGRVSLTETPGIGLEEKADFYKVLRALHP